MSTPSAPPNSSATSPRALLLAALLAVPFARESRAADWPQFGAVAGRNMVSRETGLPDRFDPETGENVVWSVPLGTETHATPVIENGRILIGTNNGEPRDPKHQGDRGVLMCLREDNGALLWQLVVPKRVEDRFFDWPLSGISSTATIDGDRAYVVDNRGVVLCLDMRGMDNGNDGPFLNEAIYYAPQATNELNRGAPAALHPDGSLDPSADPPNRIEVGPPDADIIWMFDLTSGAGIWSHDAAHSSVLIHGNHLYINTGTGVDNTHRVIRRPDAPSLVVLDKRTGKYLAREREGIGPNIFHATWSPPSLATIQGRTAVCFAAGNGIIYAFEPLPQDLPDSEGFPLTLKKVWEFDFDPEGPKTNVHRFHLNKREGPSNFYGAPVIDRDRLYLAGGGDLWWGKNAAWLKCLDISSAQPRVAWEAPLVRHTFSTAAVHDGRVYVSDCNQNLHCVDAATGRSLWTHDLNGETWASPLVADGKVFIGTRRGWFHILQDSREKRVLHEINLVTPISATAVAANGRLYVATMSRLYALADRKP
jgi:outer membrane protein assembly factor BamB